MDTGDVSFLVECDVQPGFKGWQMSTLSERVENSEILKIFHSRTGGC